MNPFVDYIAHHPAILAPHAPLSEDEQDELFQLLNQPELPETAMTAEMADGYLTACVLDPHPVDTHDWLEAVFGQASMPTCGSEDQRDRLLSLLLRRHRDIHQAVSAAQAEPMDTTRYQPLLGSVDDDERIYPYRLDSEGRRVGEWMGRDWAMGFITAMQRDSLWKHLLNDDDHWPLVADIMLVFQGYDPDQPTYQLDDDDQLPFKLIAAVYAISRYWHKYAHNGASHRSPAPTLQPPPSSTMAACATPH